MDDNTLKLFLPFMYWALITVCYYISKTLIATELKYDEPMKGIDAIIWYISTIVIVCVVSFFIYAIFNPDKDEDDNLIAENFRWIQIFIILIVPSIVGVYIAIKRHNDKILKKKKPNYTGTHEEFLKSINPDE